MQAFVHLSDELLYDHPEQVDSECRPYQPGMICIAWLLPEEIELTAASCPGTDSEDGSDEH